MLLLNVQVGDYVTVRASMTYHDKIQKNRKGTMRVVKTKNKLMIALKDHGSAVMLIVHAHRIIPYHISDCAPKSWLESEQHPAYYETTYRLMDSIKHVRMHDEEFKMLVKWLDLGSRYIET